MFKTLIPTLSASLLSSVTATLLHICVFYGLLQHSVPAQTATFIGAISGAVLNYMCQYHLVYRSTRAHRSAVLRYLLLVCTNIALNSLIFQGLTVLLPTLQPLLLQALTSASLATLNLFAYQRIIFHERSC
ncbi:GtrA family protein [Paenalcaligenes sp. Me52]|jgi:putative flippase GtrA|uniref:GtrA family protein n=1 Tax=Paenalcaligenes sp. Me52 TaxID=3392038 RepID=UPI003D2917DC